MIQKISQYFNGVQVEMKKVTWLSKEEMLGSTVIVGVFSVMIALFLFFVDFGLSEFVSRIIGGK
ncbi:MAG TPA: preprotein translocase subunit SecE [Candidatus Marinimicrobia bacterium]|jgi:preprotein translocase subunit SecE|nr:preprotein translocase subunit SecE [Candidatus Neomarinimicrobiota bacterium]MCS5640238.1 preprotein translocase subunit SecE [Candidatus Neomarinimicrobiota bacterium]PCH60091.1 MAG: preprotein translocase subunit SecE [Candidatus Neomarinimicrobiota bacterium]HIG50836.1 preprotein translocase subunit SecE [Candidatus Neomarinimicrobiota bacterium]HIM53633.1 preprotein translocase subunit SecE [Candidatus Neomarinimicrobiota bacterium]|tara:strand:- start:303 stop:494 length:192 start_codon:yes stop_codon:yes gene_type:complete